jgi:uncharacterized OB-fold protein
VSGQLQVDVCTACGHARFPPRPVCPRCAGTGWRRQPAPHGVVEQATERLHRTREERRPPVGGWHDRRRVPIAFVRTDAGPSVVAWSPDRAAPGERVSLSSESGVPVARRAGAAG